MAWMNSADVRPPCQQHIRAKKLVGLNDLQHAALIVAPRRFLRGRPMDELDSCACCCSSAAPAANASARRVI